MAEHSIKVGLIGAGGNVKNRHIPGFNKVEDLEILAVANRSVESGLSVADQFNIPRVYSGWQELLDDQDINAVCIGTWPYTNVFKNLMNPSVRHRRSNKIIVPFSSPSRNYHGICSF